MSVKITAPDAANMAGEHNTTYGAVHVLFKDGVAEVDELPDSVRDYMLRAGYTVDGDKLDQDGDADATPDSREYGGRQLVGTELRDAAVDPEPEDFLAPVNAGEADPHGPLVVAPGIHAEGERVVKAGPVLPGKGQEAGEKRLAEKLLVDGEQVSTPTGGDFKPENMGELQLSDPLSAAVGAKAAELGLVSDAADPRLSDRDKLDGEPKGGAKREEWVEFARSQGAPEEQLADPKDGGLSRDELRASYGS